MSSLIITKQTGNFFSLVLDGGSPIISEQNRLTTIGNFCNFKTANGANLILKQNILYSDITIVTGVSHVPTSINDLWISLLDAGFFDGLATTGGSSTIDKFTELLDTFSSYIGRDGQLLVVNESEQKIETISISLFSEGDRTKLDGIETGAEVNIQSNWNETDPLSDAFIQNKPDLGLGYTAEDVANKVSEITGYDVDLYPNEKATHDALDLKLNISDLPTNLTLYPTTTTSDVSGYVVMVKDIHDVRYNSTAVDVSTPTITGVGQLISRRISDAGVLIGQPGVFNITTFGNIRHLSGSGSATFYFEVYHRDLAGVETLICTSSTSEPVVDGGYSEFTASGLWDDGDFVATDRIVIKSYANRIAGGSDPVYQFQFGGASPVRTLLPVPFSVVDAGYELKANKQNDLTPDGTGTKYPTVDAVNTIDLQKVVDVNGFARAESIDELTNATLRVSASEGASTATLFGQGLVYRGGIEIENGNLILTKQDAVDDTVVTQININDPVENTTLNFPAKTVAGTYTLATTDEVNSVDLQKALDVSSNFLFDGKSGGVIGGGDGVDRYTELYYDNLEGSFSSLGIQENEAYIQSDIVSDGKSSSFRAVGGTALIQQATPIGTTTVGFTEPVETTSLSFPAKTVAGAYTLATTDIVAQTITNGVTDKSPSEDAVFDAIEGVIKTIITDTPTSTNTGGVSEVLMHTYTISGNKLPSICNPNLKIRVSKSGTVGTYTLRVKVNTTNNFATATTIATYTGAANTNAYLVTRNPILIGGNMELPISGTASSITDETVFATAFPSNTYDTTVTQYWFISLQNSDATDTTRIRSVKLIN